MNYDKAQRMIVLATIVTLGSTVSNVLKKPKGQKEELKAHRVIAGGFFAMMGCGIISEFNPDVAVGLASMVAFGAFVNYGLPVLKEGFEEEKKVEQKGSTNRSTPNRIQRVTV